jgi:23S rRNA pseudouridine1911/1915/1917 synthase
MKEIVQNENIGTRVDKYLTDILLESGLEYITRNLVQENMEGGISINNNLPKRSYKLREGDEVDIDMQHWEKLSSRIDLSNEILPQKGDLDVRYEDRDLMVIYKPKAIVVHPGVGNRENTLANHIRYYLESKGDYDPLLDRCGIVHRLDKGVSGLMVIAKNKETQEYLKDQFTNHFVTKIYLAKIEGEGVGEYNEYIEEIDYKKFLSTLDLDNKPWEDWYKAEGYIGRSPQNRYKMEFRNYESNGFKYALSYIKPLGEYAVIKIETGRMHQIRATLQYLGLRIVGDSLYGVNNRKYESSDIELESVILSFVKKNGERISLNIYEKKR